MLTGLTILTLALAPGLFWLWFFYRLDREPEPKFLVLQAYLWGLVAIIPVTLINGLIPLPPFWSAVILAPIVEEITKFLSIRCTLYPSSEFDEPLDGIIYGVAGALGFASLENAFYLLGAYLESGSILGIFLARHCFPCQDMLSTPVCGATHWVGPSSLLLDEHRP